MNNFSANFPIITEQEWKQKVQAELKGADFNDSLLWDSNNGIQVKPLYTEKDVKQNVFAPHLDWKIAAKYSDSQATTLKRVDALILDENKFNSLNEPNEQLYFVKAAQPSKSSYAPNVCVDFSPFSDLLKTGNWSAKTKEETEELIHKITSSDCLKGISVDAAFYENCGANSTEQIALTLLELKEYAEEFNPDILTKIYIKTAIGSNFFFEVAKLRALQLAVQNLFSVYNLQDKAFIFAESSLRNKSALDVHNNLIRTTFESAAAIFGGADVVYLHPYDVLSQNSKEFANELSFKQQWVLREESHFNAFKDSLSGAFYVESLTQQLLQKSWELFVDWEQKGGFLENVKSGILQKKIKESASKEQLKFDEGKQFLVGVNKYRNENEQLSPNDVPKKVTRNEKTQFEIITPKRLSEKIEIDVYEA